MPRQSQPTSLSASFFMGTDATVTTQEHDWGSVLKAESDDYRQEFAIFFDSVDAVDRLMSGLTDVREHLEGLGKDAAV